MTNSAKVGSLPKTREGYSTASRVKPNPSEASRTYKRSGSFAVGQKKPSDVMPGEKPSYPVNNQKTNPHTGKIRT